MDGRLEEAGVHYEEALKIAPANAQAHNNLANLRLQQGSLPEAYALLQESLRLDPDAQATHNSLGVMLLGQGNVEEALPHFAQAISLNSENQQAHANLANALAHQGKTRQAVHHYREALRIHPGLSHAANRLAWILATHPDPELRAGSEAVALAERFCRPPNDANPMFLDTLAAAYAEVGRLRSGAGDGHAGGRLGGLHRPARAGGPDPAENGRLPGAPPGSLLRDTVEDHRHFPEARLTFMSRRPLPDSW